MIPRIRRPAAEPIGSFETTTESITLHHAGRSDVGRVRASNADRWLADPAQQLYLVTDGMGGQSAGGLASRLVVEVLPGQVRKAVGGARDFSDPATSARVVEAVAEMSRGMQQESEGRPGLSGMGTTLLLVLVRAAQALVVHLGDSRAYLWRDKELARLTKDHTLVQLLLDGGLLSPEEAANHPARNRLTRFVGMPGEPLPEWRLVDLFSRDRLLLCTDGLPHALDDQHLCSLLAEASEPACACERLVNAANAAGGEDNITALVLMVQ
jgi:protein phosphatase